MGFMEGGGHLPWLLKNFEDLTEMIEETFLMERGNKGREGKGKEIMRHVKGRANASIL